MNESLRIDHDAPVGHNAVVQSEINQIKRLQRTFGWPPHRHETAEIPPGVISPPVGSDGASVSIRQLDAQGTVKRNDETQTV